MGKLKKILGSERVTVSEQNMQTDQADQAPEVTPATAMNPDARKKSPGKGNKKIPPRQKNAAKKITALPSSDKPTANKQVSQANALSGMEMLIGLEKEVREVDSVRELQYLIANETRKFTAARQIFLFEARKKDDFKICAVSSVSKVDRNNPLILAMEAITERLLGDVDGNEQQAFSINAYADDDDGIETYPFREFLWMPIKTRKGQLFAGMLLARERVWLDAEETITKRLSEIFAYAWQALEGPRHLEARFNNQGKKWSLFALLVAISVGFLPVRLNVLAPAEIVAIDPYIVAAPIDGVVDKIMIQPNSRVTKGQPLYRYVDTKLYNDYQLARRQVMVAQARYKKSSQAAFIDPKAKHEMALAKAELELKISERDYAKANFDKMVVRAPHSGIAVFHSTEEWTGKPVSTGQKIMTIADGTKARLRADIPVADSIALRNGADIRVFLDANPLKPFHGNVTYASYQAKTTQDNQLSYTVFGKLRQEKKNPLRIGLRGTAQIYGDKVSLYFYLFRKPLASLRQMVGI